MSRPARFLSIRPFLFSPVSGNQCRRVALGYAGNPRRCLNTSHPWNATLAAPASTSASAPRHASGPPPARPSELLSFPSQQDIDDAEIEVELVPLPEARMQITDRAAEVHNICYYSALNNLYFRYSATETNIDQGK